MPLSLSINNSTENQVGVWEITENIDYFVEKLKSSVFPKEKLEKRQLEKLAVRHLLNELSLEELHGKIDYDNFGKPHLIDNQYYISFSHKSPFAAVIISKNNPHTGIDIERVGPMPMKLSAKFTNKQDLSAEASSLTETERCALIWSAKECLYKVYGKKELDFREHMTIYHLSPGHLLGKIHKQNVCLNIHMSYLMYQDMVVVYTT